MLRVTVGQMITNEHFFTRWSDNKIKISRDWNRTVHVQHRIVIRESNLKIFIIFFLSIFKMLVTWLYRSNCLSWKSWTKSPSSSTRHPCEWVAPYRARPPSPSRGEALRVSALHQNHYLWSHHQDVHRNTQSYFYSFYLIQFWSKSAWQFTNNNFFQNRMEQFMK